MKLKPFLQVYKRPGSRRVFFGVGPVKKSIAEASDEMVLFLAGLKDRSGSDFTDTEIGWLNTLRENQLLEEVDINSAGQSSDLKRYDRQINYMRLSVSDEAAIEAQRKLRRSKIVVIGLGAGGTTLCRFLATAGIGTIVGVDFDTICEQNLATHSALGVSAVGKLKTEAVTEMLATQFPQTQFVPVNQRVNTADEIVKLIRGADFFCTTFDRPRSVAAKIANAAGLATSVPFGSIGATDKGARVGPIVLSGQTPCYECFGIDEPDFIVTSERAALMGATVSLLASVFSHEIVRVITGYAPAPSLGRLLYFNTAEWTLRHHSPSRTKGWNCPACGWVA